MTLSTFQLVSILPGKVLYSHWDRRTLLNISCSITVKSYGVFFRTCPDKNEKTENQPSDALFFLGEVYKASASHITRYFTCSNHNISKNYNSNQICSKKQRLCFSPIVFKNEIYCWRVLNKLLLYEGQAGEQRLSETQQKL